MRVLTFLHSFEPGGVERIALRLVRHWRERGVDAPLFMGRTAGVMHADVGAGLAFESPRAWFDTGWCETLWMIVTLPGAVRRLRPDVLFCAGNSYAVVAVALRLILGRSCPPIVAKISNDLDRAETGPLQRWCYRRWLEVQGRGIDHFIATAEPARGEIVERLAVGAGRVTTIANPVLSEAMLARMATSSKARAQGPGRRFVAVGRLAPQKNLALLLRAFARGSCPGDTLNIIGDGPERERLAALATRLGLGARVTFHGYVPDPTGMLARYDCLLLSSDYEGLPAVVVEALAAGLAVVATRCSRNMPALLQHGALGTLVPIRDEAAFAAAIANASRGAVDRARTLAQAQQFTIERAAGAYLETMAGVAAIRRWPSAMPPPGRDAPISAGATYL